MKIQRFEQLFVWQKSHKLTLEIYRITRSFPKEETFGLTSQLRRSCVSICANIAEGHKRSKKDFLRFLDIARGSLEETRSHLLIAGDLDYCQDNDYKIVSGLSEEIGKMIYSLKQNF